ncbi:MAG: hypothetical protein ABWZ17_02040 [Candidatus Binatia bacterium]
MPDSDDPRGLIPYIREAAKRNGIDPDVAVRVAKSEGLATFHSMVTDKEGKREPSFGAFQLYTGGGLGNVFQQQTGLDPSDPKNEKATIDFAMQQAAKSGWGPWHGAQRVGIENNAGIPGVTLTSTPGGGPTTGGSVAFTGTTQPTSPVAATAVTDKPQSMVDKIAKLAGGGDKTKGVDSGGLADFAAAFKPRAQTAAQQEVTTIQPSNLMNDPMQAQQSQQAQQLMANLLTERRKKMGMGLNLMG